MMWNRLLSLLVATRRPLVFVDFVTAGHGGKPPVSYALAYWAPWAPPETDAVSTALRARCPPGLTYATHGLLNPECPIDPAVQQDNSISDADVQGCRSYRDLEIAGLFRALDAGDAAQGEGRAIWAGHSIAEGMPWMWNWGYLPNYHSPAPPAFVSTIRLQLRLTVDHPFPLLPDAYTAGVKAPCIGHGLKPYSWRLEGLHTALFGDPATGSPDDPTHAMAGISATVNCLAVMMELWAPLLPHAVTGEDPHEALALLLAALAAPPKDLLAWDCWVNVDRDTGALTWSNESSSAAGCIGQPLNADVDHANWVAALPSAPTGRDGDAWCSDATRTAIHEALTGTTKPPARRIGQQVDMTRTL